MIELKPCPFCNEPLEMKHMKYNTIKHTVVEYDYWEHKENGCILARAISDEGLFVQEEDVEDWNRRANND